MGFVFGARFALGRDANLVSEVQEDSFFLFSQLSKTGTLLLRKLFVDSPSLSRH